VRRIVYTIGEGLLVIALFTAALSAQNAMFAGPAKVAGVAPPNVQSEGSNASLPKWPNTMEAPPGAVLSQDGAAHPPVIGCTPGSVSV
jgi:hypothetical protein